MQPILYKIRKTAQRLLRRRIRLSGDRAGGFTLVELMVSVVIVGIITSVAAPTFRGYMQIQKLTTGARDLVTTLRFARLKAVSERNQWVVMFQVANNQYIVFSDDGGGSGLATSPDYIEDNRANLSPDPGERVLPVRELPGNVQFGFVTAAGLPNGITTTGAISFGGSPPLIVFYPNGSARETGVIMMHLTDKILEMDPVGQLAIVIYKPTGSTRTLKYNPAGDPQWK